MSSSGAKGLHLLDNFWHQPAIPNFMKTCCLVLEMKHVDVLPYVCLFCAVNTQQQTLLLSLACLVHLHVFFINISGLYLPVKYTESFSEVAAPTGGGFYYPSD
jgi:hypothetical protein